MSRALAGALLCAALPAQAVCPLVTTTLDATVAPPGSLRDCVTQANLAVGRVRITFDPTVFVGPPINLVAELPALDNPAGLEIDGAQAQVRLVAPPIAGTTVLRLRGPGCVVRHLSVEGAQGGAPGLFVELGTQDAVVDTVVSTGNSGHGLYFDGDNGGFQITDSTFSSNVDCGVWLSGTTRCASRGLFARNTFVANGGPNTCGGLYLVGAVCVDVLDNTVQSSGDIGIKLTLSTTSGITVQGNHLVQNVVGVMVVGGAHDNLVAFNTFEGNDGTSLGVGDVGTTNNTLEANRISGTTAAAGSGLGIQLWDGSDGTRVFHNTVVGSVSDGIHVDPAPSGVRIENNLSAFNGGAGVSTAGALSGFTLDHNLTWGNAGGSYAGSAAVPGSPVECDPGLRAPDAGDVTPSSCASCTVDQGIDLGADQPDLTDAGVKFFGAAPDLGAVELDCAAADAGSDAGTERVALHRRVGCDCDAVPLALGWLPVVLLAWRRRRAGVGDTELRRRAGRSDPAVRLPPSGP